MQTDIHIMHWNSQSARAKCEKRYRLKKYRTIPTRGERRQVHYCANLPATAIQRHHKKSLTLSIK